MILKDLRLRGLAAAWALLAAAACGGGDDTAEAAAPAKSADSAVAPIAATTPSSPAPAPAVQPDAAILDSAMAPAKAAEVAKAPVQGPVNVEALEDYQLTMPRVRQMVRASQNLALLQERRPELRDSMMIRTMDPNLLYQRLNSIPEAREAVSQAGLSPQAYATATAALLQAMMIYEMERRGGKAPPVQYNEENVDFIAEHIQEIMQMMSEAGARMPPQMQQPRP